MMNPVPWLQMTNMISYQGLVRTFPIRNWISLFWWFLLPKVVTNFQAVNAH